MVVGRRWLSIMLSGGGGSDGVGADEGYAGSGVGVVGVAEGEGGANDSFCVPGWVWYPVKQRWVKVDWPCECEGTICVEIRNWRKGMGR